MKKTRSPFELSAAPPPEAWEDWQEPDAAVWPERATRSCRLVPTICFNCEAACGLLAYMDKSTGEILKFEGNPVHPGSRGRTCAKGPATINQIQDTERILQPLKRVGARGSGQFEPVSWDEALDDIAGRIRNTLDAGRPEGIMYHVGRPGDDHFVPRMLRAWGVDGHNSHTNVCSASARTGFALWSGSDRPSPDFENAKFILLLSAHLETGHYFNPHAQRIIGAKEQGARLAVLDTRLSNTASHAHLWISPWPGSEAALLLGVARELLRTDSVNREFVRRWVNWEEYLKAKHPETRVGFDAFLEKLKEEYDRFTPEFVAEECRIPEDSVERLAQEIRAAGTHFASHLWRNTASGNLGGWQVARSLLLLHVLTGSLGVKGGWNPNSWDKFVPKPSQNPPDPEHWNELLWPREYPLSHYEMSFLLPHLQRDQSTKVEVYFSRVYNPVWTNPDGFSWLEMLEDEDRIGCHVALTPIWSETAQWADYVLPMGLSPERHDLMSQETHAGTWIGFRQPVAREFQRREGAVAGSTRDTNPGEVWEEAEFWIELTHRIDPDRSRGIARWFSSPMDPQQPISIDDYYADIFENAVPGLPEAAREEGLTPLEYMRRYGAYDVPYAGQERYAAEGEGGEAKGFPTPSKKLEFYSPTLAEWGFEEHALPGYIRSHVHWRELAEDQMVLLPTFRLPTLIHTRSSNAKWLQEISHTNPLWVHPRDAERLKLATGNLARVSTEIGYFVNRVWVTEGIHPGIAACSHHVGRWRLFDQVGGHAMASSRVKLTRDGSTFLLRQTGGAAAPQGVREKVWWKEVGVNQNLTFPVQPDPVSGMHCWHQRVRIAPAATGDQYGDVSVDTQKSQAVYQRWLAQTRPPSGNLRRPRWLNRPLHPAPHTYTLDGNDE